MWCPLVWYWHVDNLRQKVSLGDTGGKVYILGGDNIGHLKKNWYKHVSNLNGYQDRDILIYKYKDIVNDNK